MAGPGCCGVAEPVESVEDQVEGELELELVVTPPSVASGSS
jgi:hypothetical protein